MILPDNLLDCPNYVVDPQAYYHIDLKDFKNVRVVDKDEDDFVRLCGWSFYREYGQSLLDLLELLKRDERSATQQGWRNQEEEII